MSNAHFNPHAKVMGDHRPAFLAPLTLPASVVVIGHREDTANGGQVCTFEQTIETSLLEHFIATIAEETETHRSAKLPDDWRLRLAMRGELELDGGVTIYAAEIPS